MSFDSVRCRSLRVLVLQAVTREGHRVLDRDGEVSQSRESVKYDQVRRQWRWTLVVDGAKTQMGWAESEPKARLAIALAKNPNPVAHRLVHRLPFGGVE